MFSEEDTHVEAIRVAVKIQDAHDEYEQAHSMQAGSDREVNSALYAATSKLARFLHQLHQIQPENPGLMRMLEDFGRAEKGTFRGHDDWEGECKRRIHKYAHHHPPESDSEDEGDNDGGDGGHGHENGYSGYDNGDMGLGDYDNGEYGDDYGNGEGYDYSQGFGGEANGYDEGNAYGEWNGYGEGDHLHGADEYGGSGGEQYDESTDFGHGHGLGQGQDQYQPYDGHYSQHDMYR